MVPPEFLEVVAAIEEAVAIKNDYRRDNHNRPYTNRPRRNPHGPRVHPAVQAVRDLGLNLLLARKRQALSLKGLNAPERLLGRDLECPFALDCQFAHQDTVPESPLCVSEDPVERP